ncbi:uncharacterized protein AB9W97_017092 isoform 2-T2 [Spinachia spinachia]
MKFISLIDFTLVLILASNSQAKSWNITVSRQINATLGSNVTIPCRFTAPPHISLKSVQVFWKKRERSKFNTFDNDQNAYIFHPNETFVLEKYRGRTRLIGDKGEGICSLKIFNITASDPNIYLRVIAKGDNYSFLLQFVSISVSVGPIEEKEPLGPVAIAVPVVAILVILFVVGIVLGIKCKRSAPFDREDSGYYVNFSRANQPQREASCQKQENSKVSEQKVIEEPVYLNIEAPPGQMDQRGNHLDNIYANMDYSKL